MTKNKIVIISLVLISAFFFSGCTLKDNTEKKILDKIEQKIDSESQEVDRQTNNQDNNQTDEDLLKELQSDTDLDFTSEFKQIESDLN